MAFNGGDDFSSGVCARTATPVNDKTISAINGI